EDARRSWGFLFRSPIQWSSKRSRLTSCSQSTKPAAALGYNSWGIFPRRFPIPLLSGCGGGYCVVKALVVRPGRPEQEPIGQVEQAPERLELVARHRALAALPQGRGRQRL